MTKPNLRLVHNDTAPQIDLRARINLAVSLLQQRATCSDCANTVRLAIGALVGQSIDELVQQDKTDR